VCRSWTRRASAGSLAATGHDGGNPRREPVRAALTGVRVRDARAEDAEAIAELLGQLGYPSPPHSVRLRLARLVDDDTSRVLVADTGSNVIGMASLYVRPLVHDDADLCRVAALVVREGWRDQGVGRQLVSAAEGWARERGCGLVEVTSGTHRPDAHAFYQSLGYVEKPRRFVKRLESDEG
jgi:GNAT superfamily N-acetyltransferase